MIRLGLKNFEVWQRGREEERRGEKDTGWARGTDKVWTA